MFTQPCFIRKNSKYLIDKLEELGYKINSPIWTKDCGIIWCYQYSNEKGFDTPNYVIANSFDIPFDKHSALQGKFIDCGINEDLFLALAALRNDTDKNQWFIHNTLGFFIECTHEEFHFFTFNPVDALDYKDTKDEFHKATVEELIEHFSNERIR